jgi:hypothetical protein
MHLRPKNVPPEPYFSSALYLLYQVALYIRNHSNTITAEQLSDLGDAIHNVPASLAEYGHDFDEAKIRRHYLQVYDQKWAKSPGDFSLLRHLDAGGERFKNSPGAAEWGRRNGEGAD